MAFYNLWIHFIFREFNFVSMSKIPIPLIQMESWTRCVRGSFYLLAPEEIVYSFLVYFVIVQTWSIYHSLDKKVWLLIMFLPLKESLTLFNIWISFAIPSLFLSDLELSRIELPTLTPSTLMEILIISFVVFDQFYFFIHQIISLDYLKNLYLS